MTVDGMYSGQERFAALKDFMNNTGKNDDLVSSFQGDIGRICNPNGHLSFEHSVYLQTHKMLVSVLRCMFGKRSNLGASISCFKNGTMTTLWLRLPFRINDWPLALGEYLVYEYFPPVVLLFRLKHELPVCLDDILSQYDMADRAAHVCSPHAQRKAAR